MLRDMSASERPAAWRQRVAIKGRRDARLAPESQPADGRPRPLAPLKCHEKCHRVSGWSGAAPIVHHGTSGHCLSHAQEPAVANLVQHTLASADGTSPRHGDGNRLTSPWRSAFIGIESRVPISGGCHSTYINFDNAASTPPLKDVHCAIEGFAEWYSSVHRGAGTKSRISTAAYEEAREVVREFVGADSSKAIIFVKHTTEGVNLVARKLAVVDGGRVLTTTMEHHANLLPWRHATGVELVECDEHGFPDLQRIDDALKKAQGAIALVAVSGASNVTGIVTPVHDIAVIAHRHGARIFVDAAQLAPHHRLDVLSTDDPRHLDFVAFSGHKMYAPYGIGAVIGPRDFFDRGDPYLTGGGAVELVSDTETVWAPSPEREEAGSPNVIGAVGLAVAIRCLQAFGMDNLISHERHLLRRLLAAVDSVSGLTLYGPSLEEHPDRLGILTFNVAALHYGLVAAALSWEWGIGVRDGCFCAHPYLLRLLRLPEKEIARARDSILRGRKEDIPGAVRVSFAPYNTAAEVDVLAHALGRLADGGPAEEYHQLPGTPHFEPVGGFPPVPTIDSFVGDPARLPSMPR